MGTVISNADFQAGAFDMASAEKFCKLLVHCAEQRLPVICFISSGGMQTKEGAGALFSMAAINDRLTRFIRDHELPVIVFGYGDCTGGAQASFVTHPLVQTYYFSGTSMPFAGQIVVPSNLPSDSILSNYLWHKPGAMQGLVKHPFLEDLDDALRAIDPEIPVPEDTVVEVVRLVMGDGVLEQADAGGVPRPIARPRRRPGPAGVQGADTRARLHRRQAHPGRPATGHRGRARTVRSRHGERPRGPARGRRRPGLHRRRDAGRELPERALRALDRRA